MIRPVRLATTLPREEAWRLDDVAQERGVRRSHVMRAMLRFVLADPAAFLSWLDREEDAAVVSPEDPLPPDDSVH